MPAQTVIKVRRDTAANWTSVNPTLASGEIGFETDTNKLKIGNNSDAWTALDYASGGASVTISETAPASPTAGSVWFNSTEGNSYIYYDNFWVPVSPSKSGLPGVVQQPEAPSTTDVLWLDTDETPDVPVPFGGTTGQVLAKSSSADYDTEWVDALTPADIQDLITPIENDVADLEAASIFPVKLNQQTISANYSIPVGYNGLSAGPITIATGVTVTIPSGSSWSVV